MVQIRSRRNSPVTSFLRIAACVLLLGSLFDVFRVRHNQSAHVLPSDQDDLHTGTRLFIASTHWNNEGVLRNHWNDALVQIAKYFGPKNVYVSIYESGSWDDTKGALRELDNNLSELGVGKTIVLDQTTHQDEIDKRPPKGEPGWVETARGKLELRRIPYLANIRNKALDPLVELASGSPARKFDKILFLNDVYFSIPQLLELLSTHNGHYAAACALDYSHAPAYYDTFALRDSNGEEPMMQTWPYFRSGVSRSAMKRNMDVPVTSCWNGMVVMEAEPFYDKLSALRFRGVDDKLALHHVEGSECCLIHADNPYTPGRGVWLNPRVRVGYNEEAYKAVKDNDWLSSWNILTWSWKNRFLRWTTTSWFTQRTINNRVREYEKTNAGKAEVGTHCLINEMQVLVANGWAHV